MLTLITLGRRHGVPEEKLLAGTGLGIGDLSDPASVLDVAHEFTLIRNLLSATDPALPLPFEAGLDFHLGDVKAWGMAMLTSRLFGEAIVFSLGYAETIETQIKVGADLVGGEFVLTVQDAHLPPDVRVFVALRNTVALAMTAQELLGRRLPLVAVGAAAPRPRYAEVLDAFCGTPVSWDQPATTIVFDAAWLEHPLPAADACAHLEAVRQCRMDLRTHRTQQGTGALVREVMGRRGLADVSIQDCVRELGMSERNLRRQLTEEGTSFREILGLARFELATDLFARGGSVTRTAELLGYAEPASFSKAFKRWSGQSPEQWRRGPG